MAPPETTQTPLLFGLNVSPSAARGADPVADARRAEELGFDFVSANDHPLGTEPTYEVWTMLTRIASETARLRFAPRVLALPYRHPAMVAKMAETLDRLSGGRLILGLGGGSSDQALHALGLGPTRPGRKIEALEEAVRVIRGLWSEREFAFGGRRYSIDGATLEPKPAHPIPIWLGTYGNRGLAVTGRLADGWVASFERAPPERAVQLRERILAAARQAGRDPAEITCVYNMEIRVGAGYDRPDVVSGSPEEVVEQLRGFVRMGFRAMNFIPLGPGEEEQRARLAHEILPEIRSAA